MDLHFLIPTMSTILAIGAVANILLVLSLAHTWKYWRQIKWYVILLTVGNFLTLGFRQSVSVAVSRSTEAFNTTGVCRFFMFAMELGPSLSAMAVAALALHVLLTTLTGCQGNRLRHALVLGLFVLLSLALPISKIPLSDTHTFDVGGGAQMTRCLYSSPGSYQQLLIGQSVALVFFPVFVTLCCSVTSAVLLASASRGSAKGDEDKSDLVLTAILGMLLLVFCSPTFIHFLVHSSNASWHTDLSMKVFFGLRFLMDCFPIVSAIATIVFAYVRAFRTRGEFFVSSSGPDQSSGERQKLVN